jgi:outer membrane protein assembly factor BamA
LWGRVERATGPLRLGANLGWQHVGFAGATDTFRSVGGDVALDTRLDPTLPRNAVYLRADWQRLFLSGVPAATQRRYDGRAYVGLIGQSVLVVRALRQDSDRALPSYLKPLLGGVTNLRGFDAGTEAGDTLVAGSAELRVPLTTPLDVGKLGVSLFVDTGAAYDYGQRLRDQERKTGVGGAVWLAVAVFHMSVSVAHGLGAHTRVQFDIGIGF